MSNNGDELYVQVVEVLDGEDITWIRRAHLRGYLRGLELLALILCALRDLDDPTRDPKKIVREWSREVMKSVKRKYITALDPDSRLPMTLRNVTGWGWALYLNDADRFFAAQGIGWTCSYLLEQLLKYYEDEAATSTPERKLNGRRWSNAKLKSLWEESLMPGVTHEVLAKKYALSRQRIGALLKQARDRFSRFHQKSPLITTKNSKLK